MAISIRKQQMEVFEQAAIWNSENRMLERLKSDFPKIYPSLGEAGARDLIRNGLEQAKGYGITTERGLNRYINLMVMVGSGFAIDPQLPWAAETLKDETLVDEGVRVDQLYERANQYLDRVGGPNGKHIAAAVRRIQDERIDVEQPAAGGFISLMVPTLKRLFPEKCSYLGDDILRHLVLNGIKSAKSYGITGERGFAVYVGMMLMLGSSFDTDPQFRWAAQILKDEASLNQDQKVDRLHSEAMVRIADWLADFLS